MHEAAAERDLTQPGPKGRFAAKLRQPLEQRHHRVLEDVLGDGPLANDAADQCQGRGRQRLVNRLPGGVIARAGPRQQLLGHIGVRQSGHPP